MSDSNGSRSELPIERGFPIEQVNDLADREGRAKLHYRPLTTMHKWWARRLGSVFRTISLYSLVSDSDRVTVRDPDETDHDLTEFDETSDDADVIDISEMIESVDLANPDAMWDLYSKDVRVEDTDVLDPFMGGGTSLLEAIRFDADVTGVDLNPVAWFITKKELEAHSVDPADLEEAFKQVEDAVAEELQDQYRTSCPNNDDHVADIVYAMWIRELGCTSCGETVPLFKDYRIAKSRYTDDDQDVVYCPDCENVFLTDDYTTETVCGDCGNEYVPDQGAVSRGGKYSCPSCGLKYPIVDAIADGQSYSQSLYAIEYYCTECDDEGEDRPTYKGYKSATEQDVANYERAKSQWKGSDELDKFAPQSDIPEGAITTSSSISGNDVFKHGYESWRDMFNDRQLYCLSTLLQAIDGVEDSTIQEYLLLAFSDSLLFQNNFTVYNSNGRKIESIFRRNSFTPRVGYAENNVWGTRAGRGTFSNTWEKVQSAIDFARHPTERYLKNGEMRQTAPFDHPIDGEYSIHQGDFRKVPLESEYDAIITDPPYYGNVIYSEVSDFFYVWQQLLLGSEYDFFAADTTPRENSIVSNPSLDKGDETFEDGLKQSLSRMRDVLTDDGALVFTYRHGGAGSWGSLLHSLCEEGFDLTAAYPISANLNEFVQGDDLNFSVVVVVARPAGDREPISWSSFRRRAHGVTSKVRDQIRQGQTISEGDIGIVEMGRCFREYSRHHGKIHREGDLMSTEEVVEEIFSLLEEDISPDDIYLDLLDFEDPTLDDLERLCRGTDVDPEDLRERGLVTEGEVFSVNDWQDESRLAYLRAMDIEALSPLDKIHLLRHENERDIRSPTQQSEIEVTGDMIDMAGQLDVLSGDDRYTSIVES